MHALNSVYYLCVLRDSIILILRVRQKDAAYHDRIAQATAAQKERQIEALAVGLQERVGSLKQTAPQMVVNK
jgi:hypothetical protein